MGQVFLSCKGTTDDLKELNIELREGMNLDVYSDGSSDEDLIAGGIVGFDAESGAWFLWVNWDQIQRVRIPDRS